MPTTLTDMATITVTVSKPTYRTATTLTKADVWGVFDENHVRLSDGMVIARSGETCPHFGDEVPYKSVTVKVPVAIYLDAELLTDVLYWLEFVQGAGTVTNTSNDEEGNLIIRAAYTCW